MSYQGAGSGERAQTYADRVYESHLAQEHGARRSDFDGSTRELLLICWCGEVLRGTRWEMAGAFLDEHLSEQLDP